MAGFLEDSSFRYPWLSRDILGGMYDEIA
jgi:hypothetical protein